MASNAPPVSTQQLTKVELSLPSFSDKQIIHEIYSTHGTVDGKLDVDSLFIHVESILTRATVIVESLVLGPNASATNVEEHIPSTGSNFDSPICLFKKICCKMACKGPNEVNVNEATHSILEMLPNYSWATKAVIVLAAFAFDYGEFWLLAQILQQNQLAKSVATLKRVPLVTNPSALQKYRDLSIELTKLINNTLELARSILKLEKLSESYVKDVPALPDALNHIPVDVYWAIVTVVACMTQVHCLTCDEGQVLMLSNVDYNLKQVLDKIKERLDSCNNQIKELKIFQEMINLFHTPTEIMVVLKMLIHGKDKEQPLFCGTSKSSVGFKVLKKKDVLLLISDLDITDGVIELLLKIHKFQKTDQYKILWIPIVKEWNDKNHKKFQTIRSKMPWFTVQSSSPIAGIRFIREEWHFNKEPIVVVLNPQGKVEVPNAINVMRMWGTDAFPFNNSTIQNLLTVGNWFKPLVSGINPQIPTWISKESYIIFYASRTDTKWVQHFTEKAKGFISDATKTEEGISIELCNIESNKLDTFWNFVQTLLHIKIQWKKLDSVTEEMQKLLTFKSETGWVVLAKGSNVVASGTATTILTVIEEFGNWKQDVQYKGFGVAFKEYHAELLRKNDHCCRVDFPLVGGWIPPDVKCAYCSRPMEAIVSFKCCEKEKTLANDGIPQK